MKLTSLDAIERRLRPYVEEAGRLVGRDITVDRTQQLAELVGNPEQRLRVVHVAGTSGKTSTSYYIAALLGEAGCRVGLTVSPHIDSITDRVQIDGQPLSDEVFVQLMEEFLLLIEAAPNRPTYFELMMVFALWVFNRLRVDYAVVETGLGGLHDSSNICQRPDKLAVITDIGLDHVHVLGSTLTEIAQQKLGIVHPKNTILMHQQDEEVMAVVRRTVEQYNSDLVLANVKPIDSQLALFQHRNWWLAKAAYDYLAEAAGWPSLTSNQLLNTQQTKVPGRMDIFQLPGKTVVIDGAHNQQKLAALVESYRQTYPSAKSLCVVAVKQGKDIEQMAPLIAGLADRAVLTSIEVNQDIPHESVPMEIAARALADHGVTVIEQLPSNQAALSFALKQPESVVLIVGSLYLASNMRQILRTSGPR